MSNLPTVTLPNGLPLVIATDTTLDSETMIKELVEEIDSQVFYVLGANDKHETRLFKVATTSLGQAVAVADITKTDWMLAPVDEKAFYSLPKLPKALIEKVDRFFRLVAQDLGTEAIVLLTFDPQYEQSSDGWGVLVPKQKNNAGHCNYDATSVVDDMPDGVDIVGSIHSHPGMNAFASGTDHDDQADFEGLHITFGYPARLHGGTDFHAEMQLSGKKWSLKTEYCMETTELKVPEDLKDWHQQVSKEVATSSSSPFPGTTTPPKAGTGGTGSTGGGTSSGFMRKSRYEINKARPIGCPDIYDNHVIVRMQHGETYCPVCQAGLSTTDIQARRCVDCQCYLAWPGETREDLIKLRRDQGKVTRPTPDLEIDHAWRDILLWERWTEPGITGLCQCEIPLYENKSKTWYHDDAERERVKDHTYGTPPEGDDSTLPFGFTASDTPGG